MKVLFLGTGAADWHPSQYVNGSFFRRNACALVNDDLLIDAGPSFFNYTEMNGLPDLLKGVKNVLITHSHADHLCPQALVKLAEQATFTVWGDEAVYLRLKQQLGEEVKKIRFCSIPLFEEVKVGGYKVTSLQANHATDCLQENARTYLIEQEGRTLFYACDSAWLPTKTWNVVKNVPVNAMVLELTCGLSARDDWRIFEHNTIDMLEGMLRMFKKYRHFTDCQIYTSHHAATLHGSHEELAAYLAKYGVIPAYDGMEINV